MQSTVFTLSATGVCVLVLLVWLYHRHTVRVSAGVYLLTLAVACLVGAAVLDDMYGEKPACVEGGAE